MANLITDSKGRLVFFATIQEIDPKLGGLILVSDDESHVWDSAQKPVLSALPADSGPFTVRWTRKGPKFELEKSSEEIHPKDSVVAVLSYAMNPPRVVKWAYARDWLAAKERPNRKSRMLKLIEKSFRHLASAGSRAHAGVGLHSRMNWTPAPEA